MVAHDDNTVAKAVGDRGRWRRDGPVTEAGTWRLSTDDDLLFSQIRHDILVGSGGHVSTYFWGMFWGKGQSKPIRGLGGQHKLRPSLTTLVMVTEGFDSGASQGVLPSLAECRMQRASSGCSAASQHTKSDWGVVRHWGIPDADRLKNQVPPWRGEPGSSEPGSSEH